MREQPHITMLYFRFILLRPHIVYPYVSETYDGFHFQEHELHGRTLSFFSEQERKVRKERNRLPREIFRRPFVLSLCLPATHVKSAYEKTTALYCRYCDSSSALSSASSSSTEEKGRLNPSPRITSSSTRRVSSLYSSCFSAASISSSTAVPSFIPIIGNSAHAVNEISMQNSPRILQEEFCAVCMFTTSESGSFLRRGQPCRPRGWKTKRQGHPPCARASKDSEKRKMKSAPSVPADRPRKKQPMRAAFCLVCGYSAAGAAAAASTAVAVCWVGAPSGAGAETVCCGASAGLLSG